MCGVCAILLADTNQPAAPELAESLNMLQHRGQDACGIVTCGRGGRFYQCKGNGMVRDVLDSHSVSHLIGSMGVGHVRYPTAGSSAIAEAQPFYVNSPYGLVLGHNGNLTNTTHLQYYLDKYAHRHINTSSDTELLLNLLADSLQKLGKFRIDEEDIFRSVRDVMHIANGAYACTGMIAGHSIFGFRDPNGIRPLGIARRQATNSSPDDMSDDASPKEWDYLLSSESAVAEGLGFSHWEDVAPGEAVIITKTNIYRTQCVPPRQFAPDIFEYVYFARPDSVIDGVSVYRSRMAMGDALADKTRDAIKANNLNVDVVIPVPDTSRVAALQLAQNLHIPYREGFVKNRYVGRTFIMPGQEMRRKNVRRKLNAMALEFRDKNVLLVDDSIVRGTTCMEIIQMARDAGAAKVIMASCAPPIRFPNVYGIDMPSRKELVAFNKSESEVCNIIGADLVIYQTLPDLINSVAQFAAIDQFDCSVFTGQYVSGGVDTEYLDYIENLRADNKKRAKANPFEIPTVTPQTHTGGTVPVGGGASLYAGAPAPKYSPTNAVTPDAVRGSAVQENASPLFKQAVQAHSEELAHRMASGTPLSPPPPTHSLASSLGNNSTSVPDVNVAVGLSNANDR